FLLYCFSLHYVHVLLVLFFFFQAEDGIRDRNVTGVQTCALPIYPVRGLPRGAEIASGSSPRPLPQFARDGFAADEHRSENREEHDLRRNGVKHSREYVLLREAETVEDHGIGERRGNPDAWQYEICAGEEPAERLMREQEHDHQRE